METEDVPWNENDYSFDRRRLTVQKKEETDDPDYEPQTHVSSAPKDIQEEEGVLVQGTGPHTNTSKSDVSCLVKGCSADLSNSKAYYRRFRICEAHMKSLSLSIEGQSCRFCQQCGKFHLVEEFDGMNRNCRKALMIRFYKRRNLPVSNLAAASSPRADTQAAAAAVAKAEATAQLQPEIRTEPRKRGRPRAPRPDIHEDDPIAAVAAPTGPNSGDSASPPPAFPGGALPGTSAAARAAAAAGFDLALQAAYMAASRGFQGSMATLGVSGLSPATAIGPPGYSQGSVRMAGLRIDEMSDPNQQQSKGKRRRTAWQTAARSASRRKPRSGSETPESEEDGDVGDVRGPSMEGMALDGITLDGMSVEDMHAHIQAQVDAHLQAQLRLGAQAVQDLKGLPNVSSRMGIMPGGLAGAGAGIALGGQPAPGAASMHLPQRLGGRGGGGGTGGGGSGRSNSGSGQPGGGAAQGGSGSLSRCSSSHSQQERQEAQGQGQRMAAPVDAAAAARGGEGMAQPEAADALAALGAALVAAGVDVGELLAAAGAQSGPGEATQLDLASLLGSIGAGGLVPARVVKPGGGEAPGRLQALRAPAQQNAEESGWRRASADTHPLSSRPSHTDARGSEEVAAADLGGHHGGRQANSGGNGGRSSPQPQRRGAVAGEPQGVCSQEGDGGRGGSGAGLHRGKQLSGRDAGADGRVGGDCGIDADLDSLHALPYAVTMKHEVPPRPIPSHASGALGAAGGNAGLLRRDAPPPLPPMPPRTGLQLSLDLAGGSFTSRDGRDVDAGMVMRGGGAGGSLCTLPVRGDYMPAAGGLTLSQSLDAAASLQPTQRGHAQASGGPGAGVSYSAPIVTHLGGGLALMAAASGGSGGGLRYYQVEAVDADAAVGGRSGPGSGFALDLGNSRGAGAVEEQEEEHRGNGGGGGGGASAIARLLARLPASQQLDFLQQLPHEQMAELLPQLPHVQQVELLRELQDERQARATAAGASSLAYAQQQRGELEEGRQGLPQRRVSGPQQKLPQRVGLLHSPSLGHGGVERGEGRSGANLASDAGQGQGQGMDDLGLGLDGAGQGMALAPIVTQRKAPVQPTLPVSRQPPPQLPDRQQHLQLLRPQQRGNDDLQRSHQVSALQQREQDFLQLQRQQLLLIQQLQEQPGRVVPSLPPQQQQHNPQQRNQQHQGSPNAHQLHQQRHHEQQQHLPFLRQQLLLHQHQEHQQQRAVKPEEEANLVAGLRPLDLAKLLQAPGSRLERRPDGSTKVVLELPAAAGDAGSGARAGLTVVSGAPMTIPALAVSVPRPQQQQLQRVLPTGSDGAGAAPRVHEARRGSGSGGSGMATAAPPTAAVPTASTASAGGGGAQYSCEEVLERLSVKLHGVRPEQLAPDVAKRMQAWLQSMDAVTLQGTMRSGCVNLVLDISHRHPSRRRHGHTCCSHVVEDEAKAVEEGANTDAGSDTDAVVADRMAAAAVAAALGLDVAPDSGADCAAVCEAAAARGVRVVMQVGCQVVYPPGMSHAPPRMPEVHAMAPLAVVRGEPAALHMSGRYLADPAARLHVRLNGRRLHALVQPEHDLLHLGSPSPSGTSLEACQAPASPFSSPPSGCSATVSDCGSGSCDGIRCRSACCGPTSDGSSYRCPVSTGTGTSSSSSNKADGTTQLRHQANDGVLGDAEDGAEQCHQGEAKGPGQEPAGGAPEHSPMLVFLEEPPPEVGLAVVEWEGGDGSGVLGGWWPLLVAPCGRVAAEVNALAAPAHVAAASAAEGVEEKGVEQGEVEDVYVAAAARNAAEKEEGSWLHALLTDIGLVLDALHNTLPPSATNATSTTTTVPTGTSAGYSGRMRSCGCSCSCSCHDINGSSSSWRKLESQPDGEPAGSRPAVDDCSDASGYGCGDYCCSRLARGNGGATAAISGLEPDVLASLVRRAKRLLPFCLARSMSHTAAAVARFLTDFAGLSLGHGEEASAAAPEEATPVPLGPQPLVRPPLEQVCNPHHGGSLHHQLQRQPQLLKEHEQEGQAFLLELPASDLDEVVAAVACGGANTATGTCRSSGTSTCSCLDPAVVLSPLSLKLQAPSLCPLPPMSPQPHSAALSPSPPCSPSTSCGWREFENEPDSDPEPDVLGSGSWFRRPLHSQPSSRSCSSSDRRSSSGCCGASCCSDEPDAVEAMAEAPVHTAACPGMGAGMLGKHCISKASSSSSIRDAYSSLAW